MIRRCRWALLLCISIVLLGGCAGNSKLLEGQQLTQQGRDEDALVKLQEAVAADPRNPEYRAALIRTRDRLLAKLVEDAERAVATGQTESATRLYRQILTLDPGNARARAGLVRIEREPRHAKLLSEAEALQAKGEVEGATQRLRQILSENSEHAAARALLRTIADSAPRPGAAPQMSAALRKPVTIEFKDAPLRQIFEVLARTAGLNFLFDRDVRADARTSIFLRNSTVESAVGLLLLTNQLDQRIIDASTIIIYPNTPAKAREYQQLVVRTFWLATADARQVANTIRTIARTRDVVVDEKLNMIIVRDSPEAVRMAEKLVALHDALEPEVMLEVEILEIKRSRLLDLGVQWPSQLSLTPLPSAAGGTLTLNDLRNLSSETIGVTVDPLVIQARRFDTDTNLLANPRIRVRNREKARVLIGDRLPTITSTSTATGFVAESVTYIDVGLKLDVEPTIYVDGEVAIRIFLEVSNIVDQVRTRSGTVAYQIGTRSASTNLRLKDGENQVLAGLIQDGERTSANRVPGLGSIPILGRLFSTQSDENIKTEIVLSITPRLIRNVQRLEAGLMEFEAGTDASLRTRPAEGTAPSAPAPAATPRVDGASAGPSPATSPATPSAAPPYAPVPSDSSIGTPPAAAPIAPPPVSGLPSAPGAIGPSVTPAGLGAAPAQLTWIAPAVVKVGENFAVQLLIQSEQPIGSVSATIGFEPAMVQIVSVVEGDFMQRGGAQSTLTSRTDASGQLLFTLARPAAVNGQGSLINLNLRANAATEQTRLQLLNSAAVGTEGRSATLAPLTPHLLRITP